jgi:predicted nucleotidyltransferase
MSQDLPTKLIKTLSNELARLLGDRLDRILLYGSYAREEARTGSDLDILIVVKEPFSYPELIRRTSELVANLSLENDIAISRAFITRDRYENENSPFTLNVRREGVTI